MAEQKAYDGFNNRWKFTGKELDEETGLYYFGARFYNPVTSLWLSVDPLVEKTMDAYGYCYNNPINLIDPTGMSPEGGGDGDPPKGEIRIVLNLGGGADVEHSATTRKKQIEKNNPNDKLIYIDNPSLTDFKDTIGQKIKDAQKEGYGKTIEFSVFSHSGQGDGPIGTYDKNSDCDLGKVRNDVFSGGQLDPECWRLIDFDFNPKKSIAAFYGCNTDSFAQKFLEELSNVKFSVGNGGRAGGTEVTKGNFNFTYLNYFGDFFDVFLRSEYNGKVEPMYLYTRGRFGRGQGFRF